ncbi:hypothetical protein [Moorena sp. SIOASIH]|nr:hypothetical protein [Moorena sp. SIOASIH]
MLICNHIKKSSFGFVIFPDLCFFLFPIPYSLFPIPYSLFPIP